MPASAQSADAMVVNDDNEYDQPKATAAAGDHKQKQREQKLCGANQPLLSSSRAQNCKEFNIDHYDDQMAEHYQQQDQHSTGNQFDELKIHYHKNNPISHEFSVVLKEIITALHRGVDPCMPDSGSSGSYFVRDTGYTVKGIFKPKDEEPYSILNPKWTKWLHRKLFPWTFGRSCLLVGHGYLSEAGAYLVDTFFNFNLVPKTYVIYLAHKSFHYFPIEKAKVSTPEKAKANFNAVKKIGSLQLFVSNYMTAKQAIELLEAPSTSEEMRENFTEQFQRLVILDYLTRNTDRNIDNWLVNLNFEKNEALIAAIDNGLSFPFKHPDEWRGYPYHWYGLPYASKPFTDRIKAEFGPKLKNGEAIEALIRKLQRLFSIDKNYDDAVFIKQMAVLRGQAFNLAHVLSSTEPKTPLDLLQMPVMLVIQSSVRMTHRYSQDILIGKINDTHPCFNWC